MAAERHLRDAGRTPGSAARVADARRGELHEAGGADLGRLPGTPPAQTWAGFPARRRRRSTEHDRALLVRGDSAAVVLAQVTALAALVEKETGLTAYAPGRDAR